VVLLQLSSGVVTTEQFAASQPVLGAFPISHHKQRQFEALLNKVAQELSPERMSSIALLEKEAMHLTSPLLPLRSMMLCLCVVQVASLNLEVDVLEASLRGSDKCGPLHARASGIC
jgi:hypothetical protein